MIDFEKIQAAVYKVSSLLVGDDVSTVGDTPSIVREYSSVVKPPYPYVTFDINEVGNSSGVLNSEGYFDSKTGNYIVQSIHSFTIRFSAYGDEAKYIASKLYSGFSRPSTIRLLQEFVPNMAITSIRNIKTVQVGKETQYITNSYFTLNCTFLSEEQDPFTQSMNIGGIKITVYNEELQPEFVSTVKIPL